MSSRKQKQESYISIQHNKFSECIIMLLPSYMPPEHDATAIQHPSIPGEINWLALHASVFRRNSTSKKKQYLGGLLGGSGANGNPTQQLSPRRTKGSYVIPPAPFWNWIGSILVQYGRGAPFYRGGADGSGGRR